MLRVAIVDDDASHCRALARLLRASGMEPLTFASAEEYLGQTSGGATDCVVLDIQLGGMSGFDLQDRLASAGAAPPVVFLSAHEEPETIARAARTGCAYIRKTEPAQALLEAIRRAVEGRGGFPKGQ
jgi:FixJ family two-component response regulator